MPRKRALITGGSGYLGENLVKELIKREYECSILDINAPTQTFDEDVRFLKCDIRDLENVIKNTINQDIVFHNVAQVPLAKNKNLFDSVNVQGTKNIVEACNLSECERIVFTSSSAVYGIPEKNPVNADTPTRPFEDYGKSKLEAEKLLQSNNTELKFSIIRPRTILGNGRLGIFQILFEWIYSNKNVPVFDEGDNLYQFIHSEDLVRASVECAEKGVDGVLNIGAKQYGTMRESLEALIAYAGSSSKIISLPSKIIKPMMDIASFLRLSPLGSYHSNMYGKSIYFETEREEKLLNWKPKYSNDEMFIDSYKWYLRNRTEILKNEIKSSSHKSKVKKGLLGVMEKIL